MDNLKTYIKICYFCGSGISTKATDIDTATEIFKDARWDKYRNRDICDRCNQDSNDIKDLLYDRHSKVISSDEALKDVIPIEWSEDVLSGKKKVAIDKYK